MHGAFARAGAVGICANHFRVLAGDIAIECNVVALSERYGIYDILMIDAVAGAVEAPCGVGEFGFCRGRTGLVVREQIADKADAGRGRVEVNIFLVTGQERRLWVNS